MKALTAALLGAAGLCAVAVADAAPPNTTTVPARDAASDWDVQAPRGRVRSVDFVTTEGTWMSADISPDGRWVVFDLLGHIYRVPAKGGDAQLLTRNAGISVSYHPKYSPDGSQIAFVSDRSGQDNLWIMAADGSNPRPVHLDETSRYAEPDWAPDGRALIATRRLQRPGFGFIVTTDTLARVPLDGSSPEELVGLNGRPDIAEERWGAWRSSSLWNGADRHQWPSVSPDGRYVYFQTSPYGGNPRHLQRVELATKAIQNVTERKDRYSSDCCSQRPFPLYLTELAPEVSPDGRWLAFARRIPEGKASYEGHQVTGRTALWLRDLRSGTERVVMDPITRDASTNLSNYQDRVLPGYSWARDSRSLVISEGGKLRRLWIADGRVETIPFRAHVQRQISEMARAEVRINDREFAPHFVRWPQTSPDGRTLAFEAAGMIYLKSLPSGTPQALARAEDGEAQLTPAWSPDGSKVAFSSVVNGQPGHLWLADRSGRRTRLTQDAGIYLRPSFSADGKTIYFDRWPAALERMPDDQEWEVARVSASGGKPVAVASVHAATYGDPARPDARFFSKKGKDGFELHRLDLATGTPAKLLSLKDTPEDVRLSPDGRWLAVEQFQDVYLLPVPSAGAPLTAGSATRISRKGGRYIRWASPERLEFASAGAHATYDVSNKTMASAPVGLALARNTAAGTVVLDGGRILTMRDQKVVERGRIVVRDGRLDCVGSCEIPAGAKVIDVTGKTVMPAFLDAHAHAFPDEGDEIINLRRPESAVYLAYGVTTIHDPGGAPVPAFAISDMIENGRLLGPRTFSTGYPLTCIDGQSQLGRIRSLEDALDHIDRKASFGVVSVKDYLQCTRQQRQMLAEAARQRKLTLTTELGPLNYMLAQAMNGHTGWEHSLQYALYEDVIRFFGQAGSTYSPQVMLSDFSNGTALEYWYGRNNLLTDPKASRWTPWQRAVARRLFNQKPTSEYIFPIVAKGADRIRQAGGHVAVGAHGEANGIGTHWEIWTLAAGMPLARALEAATIGTARFLGLDAELGTLEPGKIADLIILERDPLADITNTASLTHVMKAGRLYDTSDLREVWPNQRPFGPTPWRRDEVLRTDVRMSPMP